MSVLSDMTKSNFTLQSKKTDTVKAILHFLNTAVADIVKWGASKSSSEATND